MEDFFQPLWVILVSGLFAPILTQFIERLITERPDIKDEPSGLTPEEKKKKRKRFLKLFFYAVLMQLFLFTVFFICSKLIYFDKNYFPTSERELIREGVKKDKDYIIPKMTIRIYAESKDGVPGSACASTLINYCALVSISYEIVALKDFTSQPIFQESYKALYAKEVLIEPGSEQEGKDINPQPVTCDYDIISTMQKYERKTVTTRVDFLYITLPRTRDFMGQSYTDDNWDFFYYPNTEDDVIGEVEFQVISRSLKLKYPNGDDAIMIDERNVRTAQPTKFIESKGNCMQFNVITAKIPKLKNEESFGIKWSW